MMNDQTTAKRRLKSRRSRARTSATTESAAIAKLLRRNHERAVVSAWGRGGLVRAHHHTQPQHRTEERLEWVCVPQQADRVPGRPHDTNHAAIQYMVFCVGMDTRCQHSDEAACQELMDWGVPCHFSESGRLDEQLSPSVHRSIYYRTTLTYVRSLAGRGGWGVTRGDFRRSSRHFPRVGYFLFMSMFSQLWPCVRRRGEWRYWTQARADVLLLDYFPTFH